MSDGKLIIETELGTKNFDAQYAELERKLKTEQKRLSELLKVKAYGGDIDKSGLNADITKTESNIERLSNRMVDLKLKTKDTGDETDGMSQKTDFNFKKMGNTVKKFALALISVRSAYALVSRASSAYLSQDTELAEKLRSVWVGLGSFLAPVLEMISDGLLKALGYLNVFIKALTGIDYLARANAKALQSQAKAQKELNRQTYDFDVVRTQQENKGGSAGGGLFQIPELDQNVVKKLQDLAKWLKENWNLIKEVGKALLITFGAVKIGQVLKGIATLLGSSETGLIALHSMLGALATIGIVAVGVDLIYNAFTGRDLIQDLKDIYNGMKDLKEISEKNTKGEKDLTEQIRQYNNEIQEKIRNDELNNTQLNQYTQYLKSNIRANIEQLKNIESTTLKTKAQKEEYKAIAEQLKVTSEAYGWLYENQKLTKEDAINYIYVLDKQIRAMETLGEDTSELKNKFKELTGNDWNVKLVVNAFDNTKSVLDKIKNGLTDLLKLAGNSAWDKLKNTGITNAINSIKSTFGFAQGGIVTQPTRALIGEAGYPEAVVPMTQDYLSTLAQEIARYGKGGNGTVNVYLDGRLIQRQVSNAQSQRDFVTNR